MLDVTSPIEYAERADLVYMGDTEPGIRRRRAGRGFTYTDEKGRRVGDDETLQRIASLAIPPAWTSVWIAPDAAGHIQATGRDLRGRKQYRYHQGWTACRDEAKFSSLADFARLLPRLRERIEHDLSLRGLRRERVIASVVWLLDKTMIRVGNDTYAEANKSYGLTTLRNRHLKIEGSNLRFSFIGKSGQEWRLKLADRRVASLVRSVQELPGQRLFQYVDDDGDRRDIRSQDVNAYVREAIGERFTSKHFRTWGATVSAALILGREELPATKREQAIVLNRSVDQVAQRLRNTRAVCRRCYIHPDVIDSWLDGRLSADIGTIARRNRRPLKGLDEDETLVLRWLSR